MTKEIPAEEMAFLDSLFDLATTTITISGEVMPMGVIERSEGDPLVLFDDFSDKDRFCDIMQALCIHLDAVRSAVVSESWAAVINDSDTKAAVAAGTAVRNIEGRYDVISIMLETPERKILATRRITRRDGVVELGDLDTIIADRSDETTALTGRMLNLLPDPAVQGLAALAYKLAASAFLARVNPQMATLADIQQHFNSKMREHA